MASNDANLSSGRPPGTRSLPAAWPIVVVASGLLYLLTASHGWQWQDPGYHILRVIAGQVDHPLGLALTHPLHHYLARAFVAILPVRVSFAVTLVSVVAGAIATANVYGCVLTLTRRQGPALFAAFSLALANTFWQMATLAETYTLGAALLSAECWCIASYARHPRRGALYAMMFFNGLGLANHLQALLTLPVLLVILLSAWGRRRIRGSGLASCAGLWLLGASPYLLLVFRTLVWSRDFSGTLHSALFGRYAGDVLNVRLTFGMIAMNLLFITYNFPNLLLPAALAGMLPRLTRDASVPALARRAYTAGLIIHLVFVFRYTIVDRHTFFLPAYTLLAILGGIGAAAVITSATIRWRQRWALIATVLLVMTPTVYAAAVVIARQRGVLGQHEHHKPYRDDYLYLLAPWSVAETSAERMATEAVAAAGDGGMIVVEDSMARFAIYGESWRQRKLGLAISLAPPPGHAEREASLREQIEERSRAGKPVVLVPADVRQPITPPPGGNWQRRGDLYLLVPHDAGHPSPPP